MLVSIRQQECNAMNRLLFVTSALVLLLAACSGSREEISQEFFPETSSTTTVPSTTASMTATTRPIAVDDPEQVIAELADHVRDLRQLTFATPAIEYRPGDEIAAAYRNLHGLPRTGDAAFDARFLRMLGVLEDGAAIDDLERTCGLPGLYDPNSNTLALAEGVPELTPLGRQHLVHELVTAATDQNHGWWDAMQAAESAGDPERAVGLWGLVQGDAAFHAAQFASEILSPTEQFAITLEQVNCDRGRLPPPGYVRELEAYGPEVGRSFVEELLSAGGIAGVDAAYRQPPVSSEEVYHPGRSGGVRPEPTVDLGQLSVPGFVEADAGVLGERLFRAILSEGVTVAQALQAATGWGNDAYRVLVDGSDLVLVVTFEGDRVADAQELAETLGGWASASLSVGSGRPDNTGLAFEGEEYAFVSHRDGTMLMVISNDAGAGREVRDRFWPAW